MKKNLTLLSLAVLMLFTTSCATLFGGPVTAQQRAKPKAGEPAREVRILPLIADLVIFAPSLIVDFATGAIYKP